MNCTDYDEIWQRRFDGESIAATLEEQAHLRVCERCHMHHVGGGILDSALADWKISRSLRTRAEDAFTVGFPVAGAQRNSQTDSETTENSSLNSVGTGVDFSPATTERLVATLLKSGPQHDASVSTSPLSQPAGFGPVLPEVHRESHQGINTGADSRAQRAASRTWRNRLLVALSSVCCGLLLFFVVLSKTSMDSPVRATQQSTLAQNAPPIVKPIQEPSTEPPRRRLSDSRDRTDRGAGPTLAAIGGRPQNPAEMLFSVASQVIPTFGGKRTSNSASVSIMGGKDSVFGVQFNQSPPILKQLQEEIRPMGQGVGAALDFLRIAGEARADSSSVAQ